jgi:spermidine/putrescine transport system permease protein
VTTFPVYVWSAAARGVPPQVYVIGTLMFFGALALVVMAQLAGRVRRKA